MGAWWWKLLYFTIRQWPQHWWMLAWALFMGLFIVLAQLAPVVLFPIFYKFEPLDNEDLRRRLVVLSERAGTRVRGVYRWKLSEKSKKANAALTGLGATRRIILADTLLDNYTPEEIEAVLAHELGHHVHRHILKSIFVQAANHACWVSGRRTGSCTMRWTSTCSRNCPTSPTCLCWRWFRWCCLSC